MNKSDTMLGPFDPKVPCVYMETRPCMKSPIPDPDTATVDAINDYLENGYADQVCIDMCTRYNKAP